MRRSSSWHLLVLLVCIAVFHVVTLRQGHSWRSDFAAYIGHARNLVEGRPYAEIGFIQNPANFTAPSAYPPGYPLVLAPVYALVGVHLEAMKGLNIVFLILLLLVLARLLRDQGMDSQRVLLVVALLGFNPFVWWIGDRIDPRLLLTLLSYLCLVAFTLVSDAERSGRRSLGGALLAGGLMYWAMITHVLALALPVSLLVYELLRFRRVTRGGMLAIGVLLLLFATQELVFLLLDLGQDTGGVVATVRGEGYAELVRWDLLGQISQKVWGMWKTAVEYVVSAGAFWDNGYSRVLQYATTLFVGALVLAGFFHRLHAHLTVLEVFFVIFFLELIPWSFASATYLFTMLPLLFFYLVTGASWFERRWGNGRSIMLPAVALLLFASYSAKYTRVDLTRSEYDAFSPATEDMVRFVRAQTTSDDILITRYARQVAFLTGRRCSPYSFRDDAHQLAYFSSIGADYMLKGPDAVINDRRIESLIRAYPDRFVLLFENEMFSLYRIRDLPE